MQVESHIFYGRRALDYVSKTYTDQLESGEDYSALNTAIGIHFLDFEYFDDDRVLRQFVFKDAQTNDAPSELGGVRLYFVEMPKFDKEWPEVKTALDRWVAFLNKAESLNSSALPEQIAGDAAVVRAVTELERAELNPQEREIYEGEVRKRMVDAIQLRTAEERGMQQALEHLVLRQMARRLGEVPERIASRLSSLSVEALDDLGLILLDFDSYDDVEQWLTGR